MLVTKGERRRRRPRDDHLGFRPLNVDSAVATLKTKNVKVTTEPRPLTLPSGVSMRLAFIEGIDGVRIELVQRN